MTIEENCNDYNLYFKLYIVLFVRILCTDRRACNLCMKHVSDWGEKFRVEVVPLPSYYKVLAAYCPD